MSPAIACCSRKRRCQSKIYDPCLCCRSGPMSPAVAAARGRRSRSATSRFKRRAAASLRLRHTTKTRKPDRKRVASTRDKAIAGRVGCTTEKSLLFRPGAVEFGILPKIFCTCWAGEITKKSCRRSECRPWGSKLLTVVSSGPGVGSRQNFKETQLKTYAGRPESRD